MPYNASGASFQPLAALASNSTPPVPPTILEALSGLTTAQLTANGALTAFTVTAAGVLVSAAQKRTTGILIITPTDQPPVTLGNILPSNGNPSFGGILSQTFVPPALGWTLQPGMSITLTPYNDPLYAILLAGTPNATLFYQNF